MTFPATDTLAVPRNGGWEMCVHSAGVCGRTRRADAGRGAETATRSSSSTRSRSARPSPSWNATTTRSCARRGAHPSSSSSATRPTLAARGHDRRRPPESARLGLRVLRDVRVDAGRCRGGVHARRARAPGNGRGGARGRERAELLEQVRDPLRRSPALAWCLLDQANSWAVLATDNPSDCTTTSLSCFVICTSARSL
jgi:hypothetical protein